MGNEKEQKSGRMIKKGTEEHGLIVQYLTDKSLRAQEEAIKAANELARILMNPGDDSANEQSESKKG